MTLINPGAVAIYHLLEIGENTAALLHSKRVDDMTEPKTRYELRERIGTGGMAEVLKSRMLGPAGFAKIVAVKRILSDYSGDRDFVQRFIDEARLTARLQHPNICQVMDFGMMEGRYFIAMEYVEGLDLAYALTLLEHWGELLAPDLCLSIVAGVLRGLDHAHGARDDSGRCLQIVHRDVSPHNVLLSINGDIKLSDFGAATANSDIRQAKTRQNIALGKLLYMAPEQRRGEASDVRTDVYGAGMVLAEAVLGPTAFRRGEQDRDPGQLVLEIPADSPFPAGLSTRVEALVARATSWDRAKRFPDAKAMLSEVESCLDELVPSSSSNRLANLISRLLREVQRENKISGQFVAVGRDGSVSEVGAVESEGSQPFEEADVALATPAVSFLDHSDALIVLNESSTQDAETNTAGESDLDREHPARFGHQPTPAITDRDSYGARSALVESPPTTRAATPSGRKEQGGHTGSEEDEPVTQIMSRTDSTTGRLIGFEPGDPRDEAATVVRPSASDEGQEEDLATQIHPGGSVTRSLHDVPDVAQDPGFDDLETRVHPSAMPSSEGYRMPPPVESGASHPSASPSEAAPRPSAPPWVVGYEQEPPSHSARSQQVEQNPPTVASVSSKVSAVESTQLVRPPKPSRLRGAQIAIVALAIAVLAILAAAFFIFRAFSALSDVQGMITPEGDVQGAEVEVLCSAEPLARDLEPWRHVTIGANES